MDHKGSKSNSKRARVSKKRKYHGNQRSPEELIGEAMTDESVSTASENKLRSSVPFNREVNERH